jgi:hypothetical protein
MLKLQTESRNSSSSRRFQTDAAHEQFISPSTMVIYFQSDQETCRKQGEDSSISCPSIAEPTFGGQSVINIKQLP